MPEARAASFGVEFSWLWETTILSPGAFGLNAWNGASEAAAEALGLAAAPEAAGLALALVALDPAGLAEALAAAALAGAAGLDTGAGELGAAAPPPQAANVRVANRAAVSFGRAPGTLSLALSRCGRRGDGGLFMRGPPRGCIS